MVSAGPLQLLVGSVSFRDSLSREGTHSVRLGREDFGDLGQGRRNLLEVKAGGSPSGRKFLLK